MKVLGLPPTTRRVEQHTDPRLNSAIRTQTDAEVTRMQGADAEAYASRLAQLDAEWDIERTLQANASILVMLGTFLAWHTDRRFLLLPTAVLSFFLQHALQGWCPPVRLFRKMGIRTVHEIERERYALKALRGDFDTVPPRGAADARSRVRAVLAAIDA